MPNLEVKKINELQNPDATDFREVTDYR